MEQLTYCEYVRGFFYCAFTYQRFSKGTPELWERIQRMPVSTLILWTLPLYTPIMLLAVGVVYWLVVS